MTKELYDHTGVPYPGSNEWREYWATRWDEFANYYRRGGEDRTAKYLASICAANAKGYRDTAKKERPVLNQVVYSTTDAPEVPVPVKKPFVMPVLGLTPDQIAERFFNQQKR
jgi:hypothetical protein